MPEELGSGVLRDTIGPAGSLDRYTEGEMNFVQLWAEFVDWPELIGGYFGSGGGGYNPWSN